MKGEKKKKILELWKEGKTYTEIMCETGYSMAWVREAIQREEANWIENNKGVGEEL